MCNSTRTLPGKGTRHPIWPVILIAGIFLLPACSDEGREGPDAPYQFASAELEPVGDSGVTGIIRFNQRGEYLDIDGRIDGPAAERYRLRIHDVEDCASLDTDAADSVFSVAGPGLALEPDIPDQAGKLGEIALDGMGTRTFDLTETRVSISPGERSILGHAVVVHESLQDADSRSQPELAGEPVACGVIEDTLARKYVP